MHAANPLLPCTFRVLPWAICLLVVAQPALALTLDLPGEVIGEEQRREVPGSYALPIAPFDGSRVPSRLVEGALDQRAFELAAPGLTTLAVLAPLRAQVLAAGYEVLLECETRACGGFDFRFATEVIAEPKMHVDLGDFRFLSAQRDGEVLSILVSRGVTSAFVQITRVSDAPIPAPSVGETVDLSQAGVDAATALPVNAAIGAALDDQGSAALDDLVFASGSAALSDGDYPSLVAVADWLNANPGATVALVGHTDAAGSLAANIALSKRRAEAVAEVLVATYGVQRARLAAEGAGFLAPRATNQTDAGRQMNRRVEVVVTLIR